MGDGFILYEELETPGESQTSTELLCQFDISAFLLFDGSLCSNLLAASLKQMPSIIPFPDDAIRAYIY